MKNLLSCFMLLVLCGVSITTYAKAQQYVRDYSYTATPYDSEYSSRISAIDGVKRTLIEELGTYVQSVFKSYSNEMGEVFVTQDMVTLTAGIISLKLLEEDWNRIRYYVQAQMQADPDEVMDSVRQLQQNNELEDALRKSQNALSESREEIVQLRKQLLAVQDDTKKLALVNQYQTIVRDVDIEMQFQRAMQLRLQGDFDEVLQELKQMAEQGFEKAQWRLGFMYERGLGVDVDYAEALNWYSKALKQGSGEALARIGFMYERGLGVTQDYDKAAEYYQQALPAGSGFGIAQLGYLYFIGKGVKRDYEKAVAYYRMAADKNNGLGMARLGQAYAKGVVVSQDYSQAAQLFRLAAERGNGLGMAHLGDLYLDGDGVAKDEREALRLFNAATLQTNPHGIAKLGYMYEEGLGGVDRDINKAIELYRKGAELGSTFGEMRLGRAYMKGIGVRRDREEGLKWIRLAADKGHPKAMQILKKFE